MDNNGNVFVTGSSFNGINYDYATIKYSNEGGPLWTNRYHGLANNNDSATAIALDSSGNVFVTGIPGTIKYSNAGVPLWTHRFGEAFGIAAGTNGNVFVIGSSSGDFATIGYSSAGQPLWTNRIHGDAGGLGARSGYASPSDCRCAAILASSMRDDFRGAPVLGKLVRRSKRLETLQTQMTLSSAVAAATHYRVMDSLALVARVTCNLFLLLHDRVRVMRRLIPQPHPRPAKRRERRSGTTTAPRRLLRFVRPHVFHVLA